MTIRQATSSDLDALSVLFDGYRVFYKQDSDLAAAKKFISDRLREQDSVLFIAENTEGDLMGFTQLYPSFSSVGMKKIWILNDLYVSADHRRKGVAKALMNHAKDHCKSSGRARLVLETGHDNVNAQQLYEQLGYVKDDVYVYELDV